MFDIFLTENYAPFTASFIVMIGIGLIEAIGLGSGQLDADTDVNVEPDGATALEWLGLRSGLPVLIWLTSLLGCFTLAGIALQQIATALWGSPLPWIIASLGALGIGVAANSIVAGALAKIMPAYESTVISSEDLIMRRGTILEGSARRGHPARAKVIDQHNQAHYAECHCGPARRDLLHIIGAGGHEMPLPFRKTLAIRHT